MSATQGTVVVHLRAGLPWRVPPRSLSAIEGKGRRSLPAAAVLCLAALEHHRSRALLVDRGDRSYDRLFRVVALNGNIAGAQKAEYSLIEVRSRIQAGTYRSPLELARLDNELASAIELLRLITRDVRHQDETQGSMGPA